MLLRRKCGRRARCCSCVLACGRVVRGRQQELRHGRQRDEGRRGTLSEERTCRTQQADVALSLHRALGRVDVSAPEREKGEQAAQAEQNDPESPPVVGECHDRL